MYLKKEKDKKIDDLQSELERLKTKVQQVSDANNHTTRKLLEQERKVDELVKERENYKNQKEAYESAYNKQKNEIEGLKMKIEEYEKENIKINTKQDQLNEDDSGNEVIEELEEFLGNAKERLKRKKNGANRLVHARIAEAPRSKQSEKTVTKTKGTEINKINEERLVKNKTKAHSETKIDTSLKPPESQPKKDQNQENSVLTKNMSLKNDRYQINHPTRSTRNRRKGKGLWVASSIGQHINRGKFSRETHSDIKFVKAYTAEYDESVYFPENNLSRIIPEELSQKFGQYDWLGIETGSVEISNIDLTLDHNDHIESWKEQIYSSSKATFRIAQELLS